MSHDDMQEIQAVGKQAQDFLESFIKPLFHVLADGHSYSQQAAVMLLTDLCLGTLPPVDALQEPLCRALDAVISESEDDDLVGTCLVELRKLKNNSPDLDLFTPSDN